MLSTFIIFIGCEQIKVPEVVENAFNQQFPKAKSVKWSKESVSDYEAEFKLDGEVISANYNEDGTWLETEKEIEPNELPDPVLKTLRQHYGDYKIKETSHLDEPSQSNLYETELKKGDEAIEIVCDNSGKIISKKNIDETEEDKD